MLDPGNFFGEGVLAGQSIRIATAKAVVASSVLTIGMDAMTSLIHNEPAFADRFIAHMLTRNIRIEEDLVDHLFNSSEKRLAGTLLLLARYGKGDQHPTLPKISQETLAEMIGATRSRVNIFMNKFRKLGFIEYNGGITINRSLLERRPARLRRRDAVPTCPYLARARRRSRTSADADQRHRAGDASVRGQRDAR